ncbi:unnamed protein product, partial [Medioppia subpectinata]
RRAIPKCDPRLDNEMPSGSDSVMSSRQVYAKDSMDRFGDDLSEVLLSYLSLKDRFITECVSKQWQRVVFTSVTDITEDIVFQNMSDKSFELMVKKCQNVRRVESFDNAFYTNETILPNNCNQLDSVLAVLSVVKQVFGNH